MARNIVELQQELVAARDAGDGKEIRDLTLMIDHKMKGGVDSSTYRAEIIAARNRQNSRRYNRKTGRGKVNVGDQVSLPDGRTMLVTHLANGSAWQRLPDTPSITCPLKDVRVLDRGIERLRRELGTAHDAIRVAISALEVATEWEQVDAARTALGAVVQ